MPATQPRRAPAGRDQASRQLCSRRVGSVMAVWRAVRRLLRWRQAAAPPTDNNVHGQAQFHAGHRYVPVANLGITWPSVTATGLTPRSLSRCQGDVRRARRMLPPFPRGHALGGELVSDVRCVQHRQPLRRGWTWVSTAGAAAGWCSPGSRRIAPQAAWPSLGGGCTPAASGLRRARSWRGRSSMTRLYACHRLVAAYRGAATVLPAL
jgi:hypothetical protein